MTPIFRKMTRAGQHLQVGYGTGIYSDCLEVHADGKMVARSGKIIDITPGVTPGYRNVPKGVGVSCAIGTALFTAEDGVAIRAAIEASREGREAEAAAKEAAIVEARHAEYRRLGADPAEVEAAFSRYGRVCASERAREAEDVRAFDVLSRIGA